MTRDEIIGKYRDLYERTKPKLGRWTYCKYCYKSVLPLVGPDFSIVVCSCCGYGLAPMREVCEFGSLQAWKCHIIELFEGKAA